MAYNMYKIYLGSLEFSKTKIADSFLLRFKGLMFRRNIETNEGLLLKKCNSIHTFFMRFTIDVAYLDKDFFVIDKETLKPWRVGKILKGVKHVFETGENSLDTINKGDKLNIINIGGKNNG